MNIFIKRVAIFAKDFSVSLAEKSAKITRPLLPSAAPIRPRRLVPTQQGVGTLPPNDLTAFRDALQVFSASLRKPARRYAYRGLKIFTSLTLRFQDFQRKILADKGVGCDQVEQQRISLVC